MAQEPEENPQQEQEELDIESQLDALLARLEQLEPDLLKTASGAAPEPAGSTAEPTQSDPVTSGEAMVSPEEPVDQPPAETSLQVATDDPGAQSDLTETSQSPQAQPPSTANQIDALLDQQISDRIDQVLDGTSETPPEAEPSQPSDSPSPESPRDQPNDDSTASQIDQLLQQQLAEQIEEVALGQSDTTSKPAGEAAAPADLNTSDPSATETSDAPAGTDLADQLEALLNDANAQHTAPESSEPQPQVQEDSSDQAQPAQAEEQPVQSAQEPVEELSLEEIDQLLAQEADGTIEEVLDGVDVQAVDQPEVPTAPESGQASDSQSGEDHDLALSQEASVASSDSGEGFSASAQDVAQELDEETALNQVATTGPMSHTEDRPAGKRVGIRFSKETLAAKAAIGERVLRQVCIVINRPVRNLPPFIRNAAGCAAVFNLLFGTLLILIKLVGII